MVTLSAFAYVDLTVPVMDQARLQKAVSGARTPVRNLDQLPGLLPEDFRMNFVLKHGLKITGPRGHLVEEKVSQSSDPDLPRAILWDERSGFSVSYNGGAAHQLSPHRLDILSFDHSKKTFLLEEVNFPLRTPGRLAIEKNTSCLSCHGPNGRPIFSMYPDWPSFYGSDNDELLSRTSSKQVKEYSDYQKFMQDAGMNHPRYAPLYNDRMIQKRLGLARYPSYPFRYELGTDPDDPSRAFSFRPGLRMGILYNRLMAQHLMKKVSSHRNFPKMGKFFLYNLLECGNLDEEKGKDRLPRVQKELQTLGKSSRLKTASLMDYRSMLGIFDLRVNDVDMRFSYNHKGYELDDAARNPMGVGYIGNYFNSYFDGSATIDELLSAQLYTYYVARHPGLVGKATPRGLVQKYGRFTRRMGYDKNFFDAMDRHSKWIPIPYPASLGQVHHRERYLDSFRTEHRSLCSTLGEMLWWPTKE